VVAIGGIEVDIMADMDMDRGIMGDLGLLVTLLAPVLTPSPEGGGVVLAECGW